MAKRFIPGGNAGRLYPNEVSDAAAKLAANPTARVRTHQGIVTRDDDDSVWCASASGDFQIGHFGEGPAEPALVAAPAGPDPIAALAADAGFETRDELVRALAAFRGLNA